MTKSEQVQALLDAATVGLNVMNVRGLDREEVEGLKGECAQHTQTGTLLPVYPPFMLRILDILERAGLVIDRSESDEQSENPYSIDYTGI